jgi:hypothetical protein
MSHKLTVPRESTIGMLTLIERSADRGEPMDGVELPPDVFHALAAELESDPRAWARHSGTGVLSYRFLGPYGEVAVHCVPAQP